MFKNVDKICKKVDLKFKNQIYKPTQCYINYKNIKEKIDMLQIFVIHIIT
jgi:hypothetical protein